MPAALVGVGAVCIIVGTLSLSAPAGGSVTAELHTPARNADALQHPTAADRPNSGRRPQGTAGNRPRGPAGNVVRSPAGDRRGIAWSPPVARPVAIEIPRLDVRSTLVDLDLDADRRLEVPDDPQLPGWFVRSARPGDIGPAVIAGHVDSYGGPGIFWRLAELAAGDRIVVEQADGAKAEFIVERVGRWPKEGFPTDEVYRSGDGKTLRLITCGGTFDSAARSYRDNVIVFANLVDEHPAGS